MTPSRQRSNLQRLKMYFAALLLTFLPALALAQAYVVPVGNCRVNLTQISSTPFMSAPWKGADMRFAFRSLGVDDPKRWTNITTTGHCPEGIPNGPFKVQVKTYAPKSDYSAEYATRVEYVGQMFAGVYLGRVAARHVIVAGPSVPDSADYEFSGEMYCYQEMCGAYRSKFEEAVVAAGHPEWVAFGYENLEEGRAAASKLKAKIDGESARAAQEKRDSDKRQADAEARFQAALSSRDPQAMYLAAGAYEREGQLSRSKPVYEALIKRFPGSQWAVKANDRLLASQRPSDAGQRSVAGRGGVGSLIDRGNSGYRVECRGGAADFLSGERSVDGCMKYCARSESGESSCSCNIQVVATHFCR